MDPKTSKGWWLVPTRGHAADRLPAFLKACRETGMSTPMLLLVDSDDYAANQGAYDNLVDRVREKIAIAPEDLPKNTAAITEWAWKKYCADADWIGWLGDDLKPETPNWDMRCIEQLTGYNFLSTADGVFAPHKANGATVWSGDLVRAVGYLYPAGLEHYYVDTAWEALGYLTGCWKCDMSIMVRHEHDLVTGRTDQMSSNKNSHWANDDRVYAEWLSNGRAEAGERILALMERHGLTVTRFDMRGTNIMLAVPSMDRRYDGRFMNSYVATRDSIRHLGGDLKLHEMPYSSDVVMGRTKLLGSFLNSTCTHLWYCDDDMGWNPSSLMKMVMARKDFIAVAGPRKTIPASFAVSCQNDDGSPAPIAYDPATQLLSGKINVGMAFTLLTRACVERMVQSYPELAITTADGRKEHVLFLPMILNGRYLSEDFAWCHRWRVIGGEIFIDSEVALDHVGTYVYTGGWIEHLAKMQENQRAA